MLRMIIAMGLTRWRYIGLWASVLLTVASIAVLAINGLSLGLDFTGGILLEFRIQTLKEAHELNALLTAPGGCGRAARRRRARRVADRCRPTSCPGRRSWR